MSAKVQILYIRAAFKHLTPITDERIFLPQSISILADHDLCFADYDSFLLDRTYDNQARYAKETAG
ncbi:MAG: hypothetical protein WBP58_18145 [Chitinophagaceae bacterium]